MATRTLRIGLMAGLIAFMPAALSAQSDPAEIMARLQAAQEQAMQDPALVEESEAVESLIQSTMLRMDPQFEEYAERVTTLQAEAMAAQAANDGARLTELAVAANELQEALTPLHERAMNDPVVTERLQAFRDRLLTRMIEIDPEVPALLVRLELGVG